jgi:hypothetical protein
VAALQQSRPHQSSLVNLKGRKGLASLSSDRRDLGPQFGREPAPLAKTIEISGELSLAGDVF